MTLLQYKYLEASHCFKDFKEKNGADSSIGVTADINLSVDLLTQGRYAKCILMESDVMTKPVQTDIPKSVNGDFNGNVKETAVNTFMLLSSVMMINKMMDTNSSLAMGAKTVMTTKPV